MKKKGLPNHSVKTVINKLFCCEENIIKTPPKVLFLYGSLREGSYSRALANEGASILNHFGCETELFHPHDLPLADISLTQSRDFSLLPAPVQRLRKVTQWCEAMVWVCPEVHGSMSSVFKNQIDWLPLVVDSVRPTQGKLLALMQVEGGSQSFNVLNQMRVLGRWMRMFTIPNQSSIPQAYQYFDEDGRLLDSRYKERVIDVMEELFKFMLLLRGNMDFLVHRYSEDLPLDLDLKNEAKQAIAFKGEFENLRIARNSGVSVARMREMGYELNEIIDAGFYQKELLEAGFSKQELIDCGYDVKEK